ncbi:MAG: sulfatase-like hydrolase/transferase [Anaerolineae bacterium]|nr:sulfatase-like hydrolase/transferase [Anaerolineae bacterium]
MEKRKKNIVFILTDQQRQDSIGAYGAELALTPVVDKLAARGTRFTQAYTPCTVCSPARASLFSGLYPFQHGVVRNSADFRLDVNNLAAPLIEAGYRLGFTGKWHIDDVYGPTHFGFKANDWLGYSHPAGDLYMRSFRKSCKYPVNHYLEYLKDRGLDIPMLEDVVYFPANPNFEIFARQTGTVEASFEHYVTEESLELIEGFAQRGEHDAPFFVWVNFWGPHDPYILPEPYFSMFSPEDVTLSPSQQESWQDKPWIQQRMSTHFWGTSELDDATWKQAVAKYAGYCALLDWETGRIVAKLEELGILEDTIIVYTTDHGSMVGHHQLIDKGPYPYDDIQHIPLIAAGPGIQTGQVCDEFVYLHDLTPTILEWAGIDPFPCSNAQSLQPVLEGGQLAVPRDDVYMVRHHHPLNCEQRFVRTKRYKYAYNALDIDELYDLELDPDEMVNRINDPAYHNILRELQERLWHHMRELHDPIAGHYNTFAVKRRMPRL